MKSVSKLPISNFKQSISPLQAAGLLALFFLWGCNFTTKDNDDKWLESTYSDYIKSKSNNIDTLCSLAFTGLKRGYLKQKASRAAKKDYAIWSDRFVEHKCYETRLGASNEADTLMAGNKKWHERFMAYKVEKLNNNPTAHPNNDSNFNNEKGANSIKLEGPIGIMFVNKSTLNIHKSNDTRDKVVGTLKLGDKVQVYEYYNSYARISAFTDSPKWVLKGSLTSEMKVNQNPIGVVISINKLVPMKYCTTCRQGFKLLTIENLGQNRLKFITSAQDNAGKYYSTRLVNCRTRNQYFSNTGNTIAQSGNRQNALTHNVPFFGSSTSAIVTDLGIFACAQAVKK